MSIAFKSTRRSRTIRYDLASVIRKRAHEKQRQRDETANGKYVIGRLVLDGDAVALEAIPREPTWNIDLTEPLTRSFKKMARWRTKQGAHQWLKRNPDPRCQPVNLERLPGKSD